MQQNQFDLLEEVEKDIEVDPKEVKKLKEYEKLLILERNRKDFEKAKSLIKFGCFEQKNETTIDFSKLELIDTPKKYRGLYQLYRNLETMQLLFVCPLVENNKGDVDERKDLKPYAYDVIYIENMDNETYQMVCKAATNNLRTTLSVAYKASIILYFIHVAVTIIISIYTFITYSMNGNKFFYSLFNTIFNLGTYYIGVILATPLLVLIMIKYRKYRDR